MNKIKFWDEEIVERHILNEIVVVKNYFLMNNIKNINYLDIGANVGKYYDIFINYGFEINNAIMVEPSHDLYDYIINKFKDKNNCKLFNLAVSNKNGITKFESIIELYKDFPKNDFSLNLGLSKLSNKGKDVELISGEDLLKKYVEPININLDFIKIDTENQDYFILESITDYIKNIEYKPFILLEHNYHNDMSYEKAKYIYNNFLEKCNYEGISFDDLNSDIYLIPKNKIS